MEPRTPVADLTQVRDRRSGEVERPPSRVGHHLYPRGVAAIAGSSGAGAVADIVALGHPLDGARQASRARKGSSPCTLTMVSKAANSSFAATSATRSVPVK